MTADANGLCDILLIWSATDSQHDGGYVRFVLTEKSLEIIETEWDGSTKLIRNAQWAIYKNRFFNIDKKKLMNGID